MRQSEHFSLAAYSAAGKKIGGLGFRHANVRTARWACHAAWAGPRGFCLRPTRPSMKRWRGSFPFLFLPRPADRTQSMSAWRLSLFPPVTSLLRPNYLPVMPELSPCCCPVQYSRVFAQTFEHKSHCDADRGRNRTILPVFPCSWRRPAADPPFDEALEG